MVNFQILTIICCLFKLGNSLQFQTNGLNLEKALLASLVISSSYYQVAGEQVSLGNNLRTHITRYVGSGNEEYVCFWHSNKHERCWLPKAEDPEMQQWPNPVLPSGHKGRGLSEWRIQYFNPKSGFESGCHFETDKKNKCGGEKWENSGTAYADYGCWSSLLNKGNLKAPKPMKPLGHWSPLPESYKGCDDKSDWDYATDFDNYNGDAKAFRELDEYCKEGECVGGLTCNKPWKSRHRHSGAVAKCEESPYLNPTF